MAAPYEDIPPGLVPLDEDIPTGLVPLPEDIPPGLVPLPDVAPASTSTIPGKAPAWWDYITQPARNVGEDIGRLALQAYQGLDPTQHQSTLEAGLAPVMHAAIAPMAIGEVAGETTRRITEPLGPNIS